MTTGTSATRTEHPHIVRVHGVCGGEPIIEGTRISVVFIVRQLQTGDEPMDIVEALPHLTPASVYDAISYYHDHKSEIDELIAGTTPEQLARTFHFEIGDDGRVTHRSP
ncbi:MAG: DUF433 domain-containing protein [Dehalococcoidia bacterium]